MRASDFFHEHPVFTREEFAAARARAGRANERGVDSVLRLHVVDGSVVRLRRGLYASARLGAEGADPYVVASKIAGDATVAYHAALAFHGKAYSVWFRYPFLTTSKVKPFRIGEREFIPVAPPKRFAHKEALGGFVDEVPHAGGTVRVTSIERTLVDVLDRPDLGGGWEEIWRSLESVEFFKLNDVVSYALKLGSALTIARVGFFLEQHRDALFVTEEHLAPLREQRPKQLRYFDERREHGQLVSGWKLIVPERIIKRTWEEETVVDA